MNLRYTQSYPFGVHTPNPHSRAAFGSRSRPSSRCHDSSCVYVSSSSPNHARFVPRSRSNSSTGRNRILDRVSSITNVTFVMLDTRSRILFRPVDEFERLRGTNLAWFGLDELTYTQEESWQRLEGRLRDPKAARLCGFGVWTPKGYDWVYRKFISDPVKGYAAVQAEPFENRHLLEKIGDFYQRLKDSYDEKFYQQEVLGAYLSMDGGRVYSAFDRNTHVGESRVNPREPLWWALDFNVDPMSSLILQRAGGVVQ